MIEEAPKPTPSLPSYLSPKHFAEKKQQGPLNKVLSKMLKPKFHRMFKTQLKTTKKKHKITFY